MSWTVASPRCRATAGGRLPSSMQRGVWSSRASCRRTSICARRFFAGLADDMDVVEWLRERIWPLEQAHDEASLRASAELGVAELLLGGTTSVLSMETTRYTDRGVRGGGRARDPGPHRARH